MTEYDAVVYDLDGTLVRLAVDWEDVRTELSAALAEQGLQTDGKGVWALLDLAEDAGHRSVAEEAIGRHEVAGARESERLSLADELPLSVPVGVCSLNCEAAVRRALQTHGIGEHVEAVVGRDSTHRYKPAPGPLLAALEALDAAPEKSLFVGDSESDAATAEAAGVAFQWAADRLDSA